MRTAEDIIRDCLPIVTRYDPDGLACFLRVAEAYLGRCSVTGSPEPREGVMDGLLGLAIMVAAGVVPPGLPTEEIQKAEAALSTALRDTQAILREREVGER